MARYFRILGLPFWVAVSFACAETSSPRPTIAGTWHVIVQRVDSGTLTPSIFTVVIRVATESTFTVTMPPLVWSEGPVRYDTIAQITRFQGTPRILRLLSKSGARVLPVLSRFEP